MSDITRITRYDRPVRTSGTVLSEVRRPGRVKVEKAAPEPKKNPAPKTAAKKPESNDADVAVSDG